MKDDITPAMPASPSEIAANNTLTRFATNLAPDIQTPLGELKIGLNGEVCQLSSSLETSAVPDPQVSFEDTTHAYESGYRAGLAKGRGQASQPMTGDLVSREAVISAIADLRESCENVGRKDATMRGPADVGLNILRRIDEMIDTLPAAPAVKVDELTLAASSVVAWFDLHRPDLSGPRIHRLRYAIAALEGGEG